MKAVVLVAALAACVDSSSGSAGLDGDPHGPFDLLEVRSWTLNQPVIGMDSDHAGGVWVIYAGTKTLVHLGPYATPIAEVPFDDDDEDTPIVGLAFGGDVVWVSYGGNNMMRAFDATTGELRTSFASETGLADLDVFDDELRYSVIWDTVVGLDEARGGERWRKSYDGHCCGIQRGIASMSDELVWVSTIEARVYLVDRKVGVIGSGVHSLGDGYYDWDNSRHLGWDGTYLVIQQDNRIHWFEPRF